MQNQFSEKHAGKDKTAMVNMSLRVDPRSTKQLKGYNKNTANAEYASMQRTERTKHHHREGIDLHQTTGRICLLAGRLKIDDFHIRPTKYQTARIHLQLLQNNQEQHNFPGVGGPPLTHPIPSFSAMLPFLVNAGALWLAFSLRTDLKKR